MGVRGPQNGAQESRPCDCPRDAPEKAIFLLLAVLGAREATQSVISWRKLPVRESGGREPAEYVILTPYLQSFRGCEREPSGPAGPATPRRAVALWDFPLGNGE